MEQTAKTLRWKRRKEARPGEILDAALHVFVEKGFAAARLDDIAQRAGVTKGTLYLYFASKEEMFEAIVARVVVPRAEQMEAALSQYPGNSSDLIRFFLRMATDVLGTAPTMHLPRLILGEGGNFPDLLARYHNQVVQRGLSLLKAIVVRGQKRGEFRMLDPQEMAKLIAAPLLFMAIYRSVFEKLDPEPFNLDRYVQTHLEVLLQGFAVGARP